MDTHSKRLIDANLQVLDLKKRNVIALNEMAGDSVAINPGPAGEHPGASRVAGLPACIFSESFACGWYRPCKPLGKKTRPLSALSLRGESGEVVFGTAVR